jgi:carboxyl-terminal processing protease
MAWGHQEVTMSRLPRQRRARIARLGALAGLAALAMGHLAMAAEGPPSTGETLAKAIAIVEANYRQPVSERQLLEGALKGMLSGLDAYSIYLDPVAWRQLQEQLHSEFAGIGVVLDLDAAGRPRVARLLPESPAAARGLVAGDVLLEIDGQSTSGLALESVVPLVRGAVGTTLHLEVLHAGAMEPSAIDLERQPIQVASVRGAAQDRQGRQLYLIDRAARLGYVRFDAMASDTASALGAALDRLREDGMRGLVLDLRQTPGGFLSAAVESADLFLDSGRLVTEISRAGSETTDARPGVKTGVPLVVLINRETASAAEVLAAALQDNHRAVLVGERTWGKGYVGRLFPLGEDLGGLRVTVASFQRPNGKTLDRHDAPEGSMDVGVSPDPGMEVTLDAADDDRWVAAFYRPQPIIDAAKLAAPTASEDPVLNRGLAFLRDRLAGAGRN